MTKEIELVESIRNLNLGISMTLQGIQLSQIKVISDFKEQIQCIQ